MSTKLDLTGKLALVTGASRGLGKAIAYALAQSGAKVIGTATTDQGAQSISESLAQYHGVGRVLNVTDDAQVQALIKDIESEFGALYVLVNNAGITDDGLLLRMKEGQWDRVIETNLTSVYRLSKACLKGMMKQREGRIINITSVVGLMGNAGQSNYAASKAGVIGFTKSLAKEVGSRGITVNAVAPGYIQTDMTSHGVSEEAQTKIEQSIALNKMGEPDDVAYAVLFLASVMGQYITGETLNVSGGLYC